MESAYGYTWCDNAVIHVAVLRLTP